MPINVPLYMTPQEQARARREAELEEEKRQREMLAKKNREEGKPEPTPGTTLVVATAKNLPVRGRAGLAFSPTPTEVKVVDATDEEIAERQKQGEYVVNPAGAERILGDSNAPDRGLILFGSMVEGKAAALESASEEELEAAMAARKAKRTGAPDRIRSSRREAEPAPAPHKADDKHKA